MSEREREAADNAKRFVDEPTRHQQFRKHESTPLAWADWPEGRDPHLTDAGNRTAKWRGISIHQLRERHRELQEATAALAVVKRFRDAAYGAYQLEVESILGLRVSVSALACEASLTGTCVYPESGASQGGGVVDERRCLFCDLEAGEKGDGVD